MRSENVKNKTKADDLDAVRAVVEALEPFGEDSRTRIIRWATEKLGISDEIQEDAAPAEKKPRARRSKTVGNGIPVSAGTQDDI